MKILLLGIAFILAGIGCFSFPEPFGVLYVIAVVLTLIGLLLAIIGAVKKEPMNKQ